MPWLPASPSLRQPWYWPNLSMNNPVPHVPCVIYSNYMGVYIWGVDNMSYSATYPVLYGIQSVIRGQLSSCSVLEHYSDVIMGAIASQITSLTIVYSTIYSGADQRKGQSSASLAFVRGIHRRPVNSAHKGPVIRKIFPFDDVIMMCRDMATLKYLKMLCGQLKEQMRCIERHPVVVYLSMILVMAMVMMHWLWSSVRIKMMTCFEIWCLFVLTLHCILLRFDVLCHRNQKVFMMPTLSGLAAARIVKTMTSVVMWVRSQRRSCLVTWFAIKW